MAERTRVTVKFTERGLIVPTNMILYLRQLKARLTLSTKQLIGPPKTICVYCIAKSNNTPPTNLLVLPRTCLVDPVITDEVDIICEFAEPIPINPTLVGTPFDNQLAVADWLSNNIFTQERVTNGTATALLNMPAGSGKTMLAAQLISRLKVRTLYIVPQCPLAEQAIGDLRTYLSGVVIADYKTNSNADIVIVVINTALTFKYDYIKTFSLVIMDETQSYCTDNRSRIFNIASTRYVLGMSATTENRNDNFDEIAHLSLAFDGVIRASNISHFDTNDGFDLNVRAIKYYGPDEYTETLRHETTGYVFVPYMLKQLFSDKKRVEVVANEIRQLYEWRGPEQQQHNIFVFCGEREALQAVYEQLAAITADVDVPELRNKTGTFIGGISKDAINSVKDNARIILTTYGYAGTGVSINRMSAIVFYTPRRANMMQIIPRIMRRSGDKSIPRVVVDIIDSRTSLSAQYKDRLIAYNKFNAKIEKIVIK
jgi:superfamily II DNA or RNA helicase